MDNSIDNLAERRIVRSMKRIIAIALAIVLTSGTAWALVPPAQQNSETSNPNWMSPETSLSSVDNSQPVQTKASFENAPQTQEAEATPSSEPTNESTSPDPQTSEPVVEPTPEPQVVVTTARQKAEDYPDKRKYYCDLTYSDGTVELRFMGESTPTIQWAGYCYQLEGQAKT